MTGFEPAASSSRTKRATGLRYIPRFLGLQIIEVLLTKQTIPCLWKKFLLKTMSEVDDRVKKIYGKSRKT